MSLRDDFAQLVLDLFEAFSDYVETGTINRPAKTGYNEDTGEVGSASASSTSFDFVQLSGNMADALGRALGVMLTTRNEGIDRDELKVFAKAEGMSFEPSYDDTVNTPASDNRSNAKYWSLKKIEPLYGHGYILTLGSQNV